MADIEILQQKCFGVSSFDRKYRFENLREEGEGERGRNLVNGVSTWWDCDYGGISIYLAFGGQYIYIHIGIKKWTRQGKKDGQNRIFMAEKDKNTNASSIR